MDHFPNRQPFARYPTETAPLRSEALTASASIEKSSAPYPELARTHGALYVQGYLHAGDEQSWRALTARQGESKLTLSTFTELHELSQEAMSDPATYLAVEYVNYIHDIFKNPELMLAVGLIPGSDSHDEGLRRIFLPEFAAARRRYLPSYDDPTLFNDYQREIIRGVATATFNFIRFVQAQASEQEVESLSVLPRHILLASIMHGIHDLGGAMGNIDETASLTLDEPAAVRLLDAAYALTASPNELGMPDDTPMTPLLRREVYIVLRAQRLGMEPDAATGQINAQFLAKLTVADLLRCYSREDFAGPKAAFERLPFSLQATWAAVHTLPLQPPDPAGRLEGYGTEYAPAFLRSLGKDKDSLFTTLGYFAQVHLIATSLPIMEAAANNLDWPTESPQHIVNFYHLADWFQENASQVRTEQPITIKLEVSGDTVTPKVIPASDQPVSQQDRRSTYVLLHPSKFL